MLKQAGVAALVDRFRQWGWSYVFPNEVPTLPLHSPSDVTDGCFQQDVICSLLIIHRLLITKIFPSMISFWRDFASLCFRTMPAWICRNVDRSGKDCLLTDIDPNIRRWSFSFLFLFSLESPEEDQMNDKCNSWDVLSWQKNDNNN